MRIAIAARNLRGKTGVSAIVLEQTARLTARGHSVDIIGEKLSSRLIREVGASTVKLRRLPWSRALARRFFAWRFARLVRAGNYDLVIGNSEALEQDVLFVHNLSELEHDRVPENAGAGLDSKRHFDELLFAADNFRVCVANSALTRDELVARYNVPRERIEVAYPGYDPETFSHSVRATRRAEIRHELCDDEHLLIAFITSGNFAKRGADLFLESLTLLPPSMLHQVRVLAVGSKSNTAELRRQFDEYDMDELLVPRNKTATIEDYYYASDLLFYPARMEEFGLVVLEAIACGTPVLTSRQVGAAELFDGRDMGVTQLPDAEQFAAQLENLLPDPSALRDLADRQYAAVESQTWDRYCTQLFDLYERLADTRNSEQHPG